MKDINKITFIGSGNVATHLAIALKEAGKEIVRIYSRTPANAKALAGKVDADFTNNTEDIAGEADIYIVAVSDDALLQTAEKLNFNDGLVVHTSGSAQMDILKGCSENYGVFYPLQTFSKSRKVDFNKIPLCIEANNPGSREQLKNLALSLTDKLYFVNSEKRRTLHLAAVFACNFPNFMYSVAQKILRKNELDFDILKPLIKETAEKVQQISPADAQTGPAKRGDDKIMKLHIEMLKDYPEFQELYKIISEGIREMEF